jgi:amino acid transporter
MIDGINYIIIVAIFIIYYLAVLVFERKFIEEPKDIIDRFLSVVLLYAGVSLIYYSLTGLPLFEETAESYNIYIFIIGFIAVMWTIPNLLRDFSYFHKFSKKEKRKKKK